MIDNSILISRIELLNKNKRTYALYTDDTFLTEISEDTLVHFAISKNSYIEKKTFLEILHFNNLNNCLSKAYDYLQRRPHLKSKKYDKKIIDETIAELNKRNYLNDEEFIALFIRENKMNQRSGPLLIKKKLMEKGAEAECVNDMLEKGFSESEQIEIIDKLVSKKTKIPVDELESKEKQKLFRFLLSRGFEWSVIKTAFSNK